MILPLLLSLLSASASAQDGPNPNPSPNPNPGPNPNPTTVIRPGELIPIDNRILAGMEAGAGTVEDYPVFLNRELRFYKESPAIPLPFLAQPERTLTAQTPGRIIGVYGNEITYSKSDPKTLDRLRVYVAFDPACDKIECAYVFGRAFTDKFRFGFRREFLSTDYLLAYLPDADHTLEWSLFAGVSAIVMHRLERKDGVLRANDLADGVSLVVRSEDIQPILGVIPPEGDLDSIDDPWGNANPADPNHPANPDQPAGRGAGDHRR